MAFVANPGATLILLVSRYQQERYSTNKRLKMVVILTRKRYFTTRETSRVNQRRTPQQLSRTPPRRGRGARGRRGRRGGGGGGGRGDLRLAASWRPQRSPRPRSCCQGCWLSSPLEVGRSLFPEGILWSPPGRGNAIIIEIP